MLKKTWFSLIVLLCIGSMVISACKPATMTPTTEIPPTEPPTTSEPATATATPGQINTDVYPAAFAGYSLASVSLPSQFSGEDALPVDLSAITNLGDMQLSQAQKDALKKNGFVVATPTSDPNLIYKEFYQAYESIRYTQTPVFITTDSVFHIYHLIFDKMLRDLERQDFIPMLRDLTTAMVKESQLEYDSLKGTALETQSLRNLDYFLVAASLLNLDPTIPAEAQQLVEAELALINAHSRNVVSPIWDREDLAPDMKLIEDYTQYIPRGHYTRSPELEQYFKAMMWYGRLSFRLTDTFETQRALLMVQAMRNAQTADGKKVLGLWEKIYDPTVFIVGKSDDLSIYEYGNLSDQIFGMNPDLASFADETKMATFSKAAENLPPPQINSMWVWIWQDPEQVTKGFRFMGQRFTLDQYVFGQLMWRKVGTIDNPRDLPVALDFLAAQGSDEALKILDSMGETKYENYTTQMEKVKTQVASLGVDSWTQNLYWSWLYALQPVFAVKGDQYPAFMGTQAWLHKDMQTALSSWTELKHDTILYAKQVMAEMGGGPNENPPKGYVEPNPEAYARLLALAQMTYTGLDQRGLLDDTTRGNLTDLMDELTFLQKIAEAELNNTAISDTDYWQIQYYGGWLEARTIAAADRIGDAQNRGQLEDQKSALVADVATGIQRVLEEGVGYPTLIYVALPNGSHQIAQGAVYTYYEFPVKPEERMTDTTWQELLESGKTPEAPAWVNDFIIP